MKKFKCTYVEKNGDFVSHTEKQFEAADKESAALFFALVSISFGPSSRHAPAFSARS